LLKSSSPSSIKGFFNLLVQILVSFPNLIEMMMEAWIAVTYHLWLHLFLCDFGGFTNFYCCFNEFMDYTNTSFVFIIGILDLYKLIHYCTKSHCHSRSSFKNSFLQPFQQWSYGLLKIFCIYNCFTNFFRELFPFLTSQWWWWCQWWNCF
jgi:hypothetical protein